MHQHGLILLNKIMEDCALDNGYGVYNHELHMQMYEEFTGRWTRTMCIYNCMGRVNQKDDLPRPTITESLVTLLDK